MFDSGQPYRGWADQFKYTGQATGKTVLLGYDSGNGRLVPSDGPEPIFKDESKGGANPDL